MTRATAFALFVVPLCLTGPALFTDGFYGPIDLAYMADPLASTREAARLSHVANPQLSDVYTEFIPWNDALRRSVARGEWPLWNPYELGGSPLAGAAQVAPYHPITAAGLLIPLPQYFAFAAAMLHLIAAVGAFLFLRDVVDSETAALFGATAWSLSAHIIFFAGTALGNAASVLPLALLGARRIVREPGPRSTVILGSALLLLVLSGHPESVLHVVAISVAYFIFERVSVRPQHPNRIIACGLTAGIAVLLLSAIFLLPHAAVIRESVEYQQRLFAYGQSSTPAQMAHRLVADFFPFLEGRPGVEEPVHDKAVEHGWLAKSYAGSMLFAPAIHAVLRSRSRQKWFFLGSFVFGLGAGIAAPGLTHVLRYMPGFSMSINDRMISFAIVGACGLGALGLDAWLRNPADRLLPRVFLLTALFLVVAAIVIPTGIAIDYVRVGLMRAVLPVLIAAGTLAVLGGQRAVIVLLALLVLQRFGEAGRLQPTIPADLFYPPFAGLQLMRAAEPFRVVAVASLLPPAISTHYGLEDLRGFQAVTFARYDATIPVWSRRQHVWSNRVDDLSSPFLSLANVRFAILPSNYTEAQGWVRRGQFGSYAVSENTRVLPRAFVPATVHLVRSKGASLQGVAHARDFSAESWIESDRESTSSNGPGVVTVDGRGHHLRLTARMADAGWVVVSNTAWNGWRGTMNGRDLPIHYANHTFLAFQVPKGNHEIELIYRPRAFVIGAWISAVTVVVLAGFALRNRVTGSRGQSVVGRRDHVTQ